MVLSRHFAGVSPIEQAGTAPMAKKTERLHAQVYGRVQGVSFRFYTRDQAVALGITGWVSNRADGSVEVVAEGPRPALERLLAWLRHGPPVARIDDLHYDFLASTGAFDQFTIEF
jgi:acylphosphatase